MAPTISEDTRIGPNATVQGDANICTGPVMITGYATVQGDAIVGGKASVTGDARIQDRAYVWGWVKVGGRATVTGRARISGRAVIRDEAVVCGEAQVMGDALVSGLAYLAGTVRVWGNARVHGGAFYTGALGDDAEIFRADHVITLTGVFLEQVTVYRTSDGSARVQAGCQNFPLALPTPTLKKLAAENDWTLPAGWASIRKGLLMMAAEWADH